MDTLHDRERAQSLVIVALMLVVLIGMVALIIDGGMAYAQRRNAQNAADAAALAGAQELCAGRIGNVDPVVQDYAVTRNNVDSALPSINSDGLTVVVTSTYNTFFANILNRPQMTVSASATAGCFKPCTATDVLPIGWSCREPSFGASGTPTPPAPINGKLDCEIQYDPTDEYKYRYVIMDSSNLNVDLICLNPDPDTPPEDQPVGGVDCDLNPKDGYIDFMAGGNRSWLNLDGGVGNANELADWMKFGYTGVLSEHTWVPGVTGNMDHAYQISADYLLNKKEVIIPVYDQYCEGLPSKSSPTCGAYWHPNISFPTITDTVHAVNATWADYFHVISFSVFKITCMEFNSQVKTAPGYPNELDHGYCKGKYNFLESNKATLENVLKINQGDFKKLNSIEGYFIRRYVPENQGACGTPDEYGSYTVYLK